MAILFFTKGDKSVGSSRQRVWLVAEKLQKAYGYEYEILHSMAYPAWSLTRMRARVIRTSWQKLSDPRYEILFVHKSFFSVDIVVLIFLAKLLYRKKLLYDLDDAEWVHSPVKTNVFARLADSVFCGSEVIRAWVAKRNSSAILIPTALDHELYATHRVAHVERAVYTIGWVGAGMRHFKDGHFHMIKSPLESLAKSGIGFRLVILGAQNYKPLKDFFNGSAFKVVYLDALDWSDPAAVPKAIQMYAFDVGLTPQSDTPFNRAKCAYKAIEYMACGVPTIVSPVGENKLLIQHGVNGFWAEGKQEWEEQLRILLTDVFLRTTVGAEALKTIEARYSYKAILPRIVDVLKRFQRQQ